MYILFTSRKCQICSEVVHMISSFVGRAKDPGYCLTKKVLRTNVRHQNDRHDVVYVILLIPVKTREYTAISRQLLCVQIDGFTSLTAPVC